jgi:hypothetical protein
MGMGTEMETLKFQGTDFRGLLDILIEAVQIAAKDGQRPKVEVNGKIYAEYDLLKIAGLMPDEELTAEHQAKVDAIFQKKQFGYRGTGYNLANRANQIASAAARRKMLLHPSVQRERGKSITPGSRNSSSWIAGSASAPSRRLSIAGSTRRNGFCS